MSKQVVIFNCANKNANFSLGKFSIRFHEVDWQRSGSMYATSNKEEIEAIKESAYFKQGLIKLAPAPRKSKKAAKGGKAEKKQKKALQYPDVKRVQDAITVIRNVCQERGVNCPSLKNKQSVLSMAKSLNIEFPSIQ